MTTTPTSNRLTPTRVSDLSIEPTLRVQLYEFGEHPLDRFTLVRITARTGAGEWRSLVLRQTQWQALMHALLDAHLAIAHGRVSPLGKATK
jgi:hypothetical protein